ncbi:MAG: AbrB/MazE/SpoVT family DNA-binding domain-containing protein [Firmicutes bacterium]|uniref:AbrB family transcriptional regulator n=1 Tax=Sulfobacillus benefaciens TaxID=453960 RepID=A0A2T2WEZ7_9FIRM|nr:AbrB/MazE/SpoVT family DNA-binding domain-containing protein [Bacillota bacterium]PSR20817.1 MAG: AbrB family transcriptional regulator [Sulfobacillus benefaciens]
MHGIVRRMDAMGRVVLPSEFRRILQIAYKAPFEMFVDGESIVLKKYEPACIFCGHADHLATFRGKRICQDCLTRLPIEAV